MTAYLSSVGVSFEPHEARQMSKQELEEKMDEDRRRQDRELKKQFRLAFGDV